MKIRTLIFTLLVIALCVPAIYADSLDEKIEQQKHRQPERLKIIKQMIKEGYIQKITVPTSLYPRMYVERKFYSLTYDDKKALSIIVWSYYITKNRKAEILIIRDGYTGKDLGGYDKNGFTYNP